MGIHDGHRGRLKERYVLEGGENFAEHNLLELLLFYAIPRKDTNDTAHRLLGHFGSVRNVLEAPVEELCRVSGINESSAILIRLVGELGERFCDRRGEDVFRFYSYDDMGRFFAERLANVRCERVLAAYTDNLGKLIKLEIVCNGDVNSAIMDSRKIVSTAMAIKAASVVLAHNHPGGTAIPSGMDLDTTRALKGLLSSAGVELIEHYIIADDGICRIMEDEKKEEGKAVELKQNFFMNGRE